MGNPSRSIQAPGGTRGANQALIVIFERDESLSGLLLGQLRAQGYEGRTARTPVEVFDLIARYPVRLALVNLGQPATSRREFWVALDAQRFGRGVQVITYSYVVPGVEPDLPAGSGRPDVEVRGPQGISALIEAVRAKLPPPPRETPDSSFLLGSKTPGLSANGQPTPGPQPGLPPTPLSGNPPEYAARQQPIAGILDLSHGGRNGQPSEFLPLASSPGASRMNPADDGWVPLVPEASPMNGAAGQGAPPWMNGRAEPPAAPAGMGASGWPGAGPRPEPPGNSQMNGANSNGANGMRTPGADVLASGGAFSPAMPMGDLAALSDAINALAAAGAPGYQHASAAAKAMNGAQSPGKEPDPWLQGQSHAVQEMGALTGRSAGNSYPVSAPPGMPEERQAFGSLGAVNQSHQGGQPTERGAAETLYMGQKAFVELGRAQESRQQPQESRSRTIAGNLDEYEQERRAPVTAMPGNGNQQPAASRRLGEATGPAANANQSASYQNQMLAPIVAPGQVERSLGNVLVEGQLVSQQRLEVALGIQRLLRGVDMDYRLGEVLLTFKFLTHDQLLAALLVSRGLVTPAQVASLGRIKQELHSIGMEYDLENLLILFRMLSSEQLREIRNEFP
ncbi:MAG TPA: hypothetical protein VFU69_02030 [Ktedonobacterales bacterium]|nr:hypothetical protein [Ktedonobacterales bacterium]